MPNYVRALALLPNAAKPFATTFKAYSYDARELVAVTFARKITREPAKLTKMDYDALVHEFQPQGALEVLLQCGNFAYLNRFTDGLRLPSEDEALKIYQETYGKSFEQVRKARN